jgi:hypothetical protein
MQRKPLVVILGQSFAYRPATPGKPARFRCDPCLSRGDARGDAILRASHLLRPPRAVTERIRRFP